MNTPLSAVEINRVARAIECAEVERQQTVTIRADDARRILDAANQVQSLDEVRDENKRLRNEIEELQDEMASLESELGK